MGMIGEHFEKVGENNRAKSQLFAILSGLMFGTGWWIIIGASANTEHGADLNGEYYLPGIFQVVSFLLINLISWEALDANNADQFSAAATNMKQNDLSEVVPSPFHVQDFSTSRTSPMSPISGELV